MRLLSLILPAALGASLAAGAVPPADPGDAHARIAAAESRVAAIGFRLATRNADWCDRRAPQLGWILGDRRLYTDAQWPAARAAYTASDSDAPFVAAIVPGGPADRAGLNIGDSLDPPGIALSASGSAPHARIDAVERWVSSRGARIEVQLSVNGKMRSIAPTPGCYGDFRVEATAALNAAADGRVVKIPAGLAALFARDDELAAVVAHELAHNILSHRERLDAAGVPPDRRRLSKRDQERIRLTEVDADALSVWLLAGAGFDPNAALSMWDRLARAKGPQLFPAATHPSHKVRSALLRANIDAMTTARARNPAARPPMIDAPRALQ
ncbi:MAG: hypothetical protein RLZZ58_1337 [Pseudomonadota bacterium]|jgi:hypothetical protein